MCVLRFQVSEGTNVVLQHNIVAGYERVAYRIDGEPCPGTSNDLTSVQLIVSGYISPVCTLNAQTFPPRLLPAQVI